ncbi:MAG: DUF4349 domain-containing protein [Gemmatimonadales bacterium]|nr:DUF4349 domain-containing protein [Gemmatimonadales bacterium]
MSGRIAAAVMLLGAMLVGCGSDGPTEVELPAGELAVPAKVAPGLLGNQATRSMAADAAGFAQPVPSEPPMPVVLPDRMLIRTGYASIRVDTLEAAIRRVTEVAGLMGGYVANSSFQTGEQAARSATLEIKLPTARYQAAFDQLSGIGRVTNASTSTQDVGEEYVDISARTANAKRLEERLVTLLATRAGKLEEVLGVERELARVRQEIERYEGRLRYLERQVAMSTLSVTVFESGPLVGNPGDNVIRDAFKEAWRNFVGVVAGGIALLGVIVPVGLVLVGVGFGVRSWRRRLVPAAPRSISSEGSALG